MENEKYLIQRAQSGDIDAFSQLLTAHENNVYAVALRYCGNPEDAEDITQEVFLSAWTHLPNFRGESSLSTWLYRLVTNACHDWHRKRAKESGNISLEAEETPLDIPDFGPSPEELAEQKELQENVQLALDSLSEDFRTILILREVNQLSYEEISSILDLDLGTVKSRIHRARKECADFLIKRGTFSHGAPSKKQKNSGREGTL